MNCEDCDFYDEETKKTGTCTKDNSEVDWNGYCPCWKPKSE